MKMHIDAHSELLKCVPTQSLTGMDNCHVGLILNISSDAENSRSACFDWHKFIRTGMK